MFVDLHRLSARVTLAGTVGSNSPPSGKIQGRNATVLQLRSSFVDTMEHVLFIANDRFIVVRVS